MRKALLTITLLVCSIGVVNAELYDTPKGPTNLQATADYAGVDRSTVAFSSAGVLCFSGQGSVVGIVVDSGTSAQDFFIFRDTGNLIAGAVSGGATGVAADDYVTSDSFAKIQYSSASIVGDTGAPRLTFTYVFPKPIRVYRGLVVKASVNTMRLITVLWTKFGGQ